MDLEKATRDFVNAKGTRYTRIGDEGVAYQRKDYWFALKRVKPDGWTAAVHTPEDGQTYEFQLICTAGKMTAVAAYHAALETFEVVAHGKKSDRAECVGAGILSGTVH